MEVDRKRLLSAIERVLPAVAKKEVFEQANKLAFIDGHLVAYNDEVSIFERLSDVEGVDGAIDGKRLHDLLSKVTADAVTLSATGAELLLRAGRSRATFALLPVALPVGELDRSGEVIPLPEGFSASLALAAGSCARDMRRPVLTCVRLGGEVMESTDGFRLARLRLDGVELPEALLPAPAAEVVTDHAVDGLAVGEGGEWARFNANGGDTVVFARLAVGHFPDLTHVYEVEGGEVTLPASLSAVLDRARVFSKRPHRVDEVVRLTLRPNQIEVRASDEGVQFAEVLRWEGSSEAEFSIHPDFLAEALKSGTSCVVGEGKVKFVGGNWEHVIALR